ncbi:hypothetical protein RFF84_10405, partial [Streptococcus ruminantium]|nr:hypothetical protein [Streptococcus ruminantium]
MKILVISYMIIYLLVTLIAAIFSYFKTKKNDDSTLAIDRAVFSFISDKHILLCSVLSGLANAGICAWFY